MDSSTDHSQNVERQSVPNPALLSDLAASLLQQESRSREAKAAGQAPGAITGFRALDAELGGFLSPGVHTLLAAPSAGKSALALQIASSCGCPCFYLTSEMPRDELMRRLVARATSTYLGKLRGGNLSEDELRSRIAATAAAYPMLALHDAILDRTSADDIHKKAEALRSRFDSRHLLIVVDSVTDWAMSTAEGTGTLSEYMVTEAALTALTRIGKRLACPVIAIAHRNRSGQKAQGMERLYSGKATGRYEYLSDSLWDLERDVTVEADGDGCTRAELTLLKNRCGEQGVSVALRFEGRLQKFSEIGG